MSKLNSKTIILPLPNYGFDPTEVAIFWKVLTQSGHCVKFSTPTGNKAQADRLMLKGEKLGVFKFILQARKDAVEACVELDEDKSFCNPITYSALKEKDYDAIYLPGGHDKTVKEYLESSDLQNLIVDFFQANKPIAAICHGVVLVARSIDKHTQKSVIHKYKTTALLKSQERAAYNLTRLWLKDYYLTYPEITVEDEVTSVLAESKNFIHGPKPIFRDRQDKLKHGFCVEDRNFISARWPGDIYTLSNQFLALINKNIDF